ncbi:ABC transporter ATP-binding protein/permease [Enterococcus durans]|uniref:ABC transporter transmembrane domain-containing protein n=1 Tax=Enterococcus durans TaxID=53345 RepID=UPI0020188868|nr:ABC transporter ATP-binding protein [Enterococcus durans]UQR06183.1 ABC transporter ATP-binding protein/permease [Enterococcus durans]
MRLILQRYPTNVIKMVFLTGILSGLRVLPSYLLVYATNAIFKFDVKAFLFWDGFILFLWLVFIVFNYFIATYQEKSIQQISTSLRLSEAKKITQLSPNQFKTITAEGYISKLSNDINQIELQGLTSLYGIIANLWLIFFSTLALCLLNLWLAAAVLILSGLVLYLPNRFEKQLVFIGKKLSTSNSRFMKETTNILKGYNVLRYSNILKIIPEKISIFSNNLAEDKVEIVKVKNKVTSFLVFSSLVSQVLVDILTGYLVIIGQTTLGAISSSGNLAANIFNSISLTGQQFVQLKSANPVVADFFEEVEPAKEKKLLPDFNTVKLEQVTFGYKEDKPILKDINLVIEKGKNIY